MKKNDTVKLVNNRLKNDQGFLVCAQKGELFTVESVSGSQMTVRNEKGLIVNLLTDRFVLVKRSEDVTPIDINGRFIKLVEVYGIQRVSFCTGCCYEILGRFLNNSMSPQRSINPKVLEVAEHRCKEEDWSPKKWADPDTRRVYLRTLIDAIGIEIVVKTSGLKISSIVNYIANQSLVTIKQETLELLIYKLIEKGELKSNN